MNIQPTRQTDFGVSIGPNPAPLSLAHWLPWTVIALLIDIIAAYMFFSAPLYGRWALSTSGFVIFALASGLVIAVLYGVFSDRHSMLYSVARHQDEMEYRPDNQLDRAA
jgi:hypothetical protein